MNAYELVDKWVKEEKRHFFPDNMFQSKDEKIALEILKQYYEARYEPSDNFRYCGIWYIDNPYCPKGKWYELRYCFKKSGKWETLTSLYIANFPNWDTRFAKEIRQLEKDCKESEEKIAKLITQNFYYVGKHRYWEVIETEYYL